MGRFRLHNETFWLGWATVAQYGWAPGAAPLEQTEAEFMKIYYGFGVTGMDAIYRGLQEQARFFQNSWDRTISKVREPGRGNPWPDDIQRLDRTLPPPPLPVLPGLEFTPVYSGGYRALIERAPSMLANNDALRQCIHENILKADRNRYNLEVFLSLAHFTAHHARLLGTLGRIEENLKAAHDAAVRKDARTAVGNLVAAYSAGQKMVTDRRQVFAALQSIWEKSRFPKGQEVGGRKFLHVMDDVKDHWADRRSDLTYLTAPEESIGLEQWATRLAGVIGEYAKRNGVPVRGLNERAVEE